MRGPGFKPGLPRKIEIDRVRVHVDDLAISEIVKSNYSFYKCTNHAKMSFTFFDNFQIYQIDST